MNKLSCQFLFFSRENDDMESSKRSVKLFSLSFIIICLTKCNLIRKLRVTNLIMIEYRELKKPKTVDCQFVPNTTHPMRTTL